MNRIAVLAVFLSVLSTMTRGDDKPTLAQCRTDSANWWQTVVQQPKADKLPFVELERRVEQLQLCAIQDTTIKPENEQYMSLLAHYEHEQIERLNSFMLRHKLWAQFHSEDAKGEK
jgi:hypothetical protein